MASSSSENINAVSCQTFHIAGILTDVFGLKELSPHATSISCLWLLHPRLQKKEGMASIASRCINHWNKKFGEKSQVGLIAVAFDSRNHGTREVRSEANGTWKDGNETHAQDMFSIIHGTALDTSLLIDHLESYIFRKPENPSIHEHLVLGVSLGGHGAWQVLFNEPRVTTAIVVIGCPDYLDLLRDRARRLSRESYTISSGTTFAGSVDFPPALITTLANTDPKAILFSSSTVPPTSSDLKSSSNHNSNSSLTNLLTTRISNKNVLVQSGSVDKLVPYACSEPFIHFLQEASGAGGCFEDGGFVVDDRVYEGVGHRFSEEMMDDAVRFVGEVVGKDRKRNSKVWERGAKAEKGSERSLL